MSEDKQNSSVSTPALGGIVTSNKTPRRLHAKVLFIVALIILVSAVSIGTVVLINGKNTSKTGSTNEQPPASDEAIRSKYENKPIDAPGQSGDTVYSNARPVGPM